MARHCLDMSGIIDDWEARNRINEAIDALVDDAELSAESDPTHWMARHSTGRLDIDAEREALAEWFGIN